MIRIRLDFVVEFQNPTGYRLHRPGDCRVFKLSKKDAENLKSGKHLNYLGVKVVNLQGNKKKLNQYSSEDRLALVRDGILFLSKERYQQLGPVAHEMTPVLDHTGGGLEAGELSEEDAPLAAFPEVASAQGEDAGATHEMEAGGEAGSSAQGTQSTKRVSGKNKITPKGTQAKWVKGLDKNQIVEISTIQANILRDSRRFKRASEEDRKADKKREAWEYQDNLKWARRERAKDIADIRDDRKRDRIDDRKDDLTDLRSERKEDRIEEGQKEQAKDIKELHE